MPMTTNKPSCATGHCPLRQATSDIAPAVSLQQATAAQPSRRTDPAPGRDQLMANDLPLSVPKVELLPCFDYAAQAVTARASVERQARVLADSLKAAQMSPSQASLAYVVDVAATDHKTLTTQAQELASMLETAAAAGIELSVVAVLGERAVDLTIGLRPGATTAERSLVVERLLALGGGVAAQVSAETRSWLHAVDQRSHGRTVPQLNQGRGVLVGLERAKALLDSTPADVACRGILVSQCHGIGALVRANEQRLLQEGIGATGVASAQAHDHLAAVLKHVMADSDPSALKEFLGTQCARALLQSAAVELEAHVGQLSAYAAALAEYQKENQRETADAWFETTERVLTHETREHFQEVAHRYRASPIVMDLTGDGIKIDAVPHGGYLLDAQTEVRSTLRRGEAGPATVTGFDGSRVFGERTEYTSYRTVEKTTVETRRERRFAEWIGKNTGLLVLDRNGDGKIGPEDLFGDQSVTGRPVTNGYEDLKLLDVEKRGRLDKDSAYYNKLRVWRDANSNFEVDPGELLTLADAGVSVVRLNYDETGDALLRQRATFRSTRADALAANLAATPRVAKGSVDVVVQDGKPVLKAVGCALASAADVKSTMVQEQQRLFAIRGALRSL